ncbi:MAG: dihydroneopterin aldolase [Alphaproteobacteria bacterium]|nr:dihydroneopterin aldolase [Alphaproteobacteria bacterium]
MILRIHDLKLFMILGAHAWEQEKPREASLDLAVEYDASKAMAGDLLTDALDYDILARQLKEALEPQRIALIEHLAGKALDIVFRVTPALRAEITVTKPGAMPTAKAVSFTLARSRKEAA